MIDNQKIGEIANEYGTPFYLIDYSKIEERFDKLKKSFPQDTSIAYAVKANYTSSIVQKYNELGAHFDIFSKGELDLLSNYDCNLERGIYTSVAETEEEFKHSLDLGVQTFVLGSVNGIRNFDRAFQRSNAQKADVMLRIQPIEDVEAFISTSGTKSKFGTVFTDENDSVENALDEIKKSHVDFSGFHFHLGTQVKNSKYYADAIDRTLQFAQEKGLEIKMLDIGGGYPVQYSSEVKPIEEYGRVISEKIESWRRKIGNFRLFIEPGRFLTAPLVNLVTSVANVKEMYGRKVVIVDGSEDMLSLDEHDIEENLNILTDEMRTVETTIAGNLCHSEDWLVRDPLKLPEVKEGDMIIFERMGAYVFNRNTAYNLTELPKILVLKQDRVKKEKHPFEIAREILGLE